MKVFFQLRILAKFHFRLIKHSLKTFFCLNFSFQYTNLFTAKIGYITCYIISSLKRFHPYTWLSTLGSHHTINNGKDKCNYFLSWKKSKNSCDSFYLHSADQSWHRIWLTSCIMKTTDFFINQYLHSIINEFVKLLPIHAIMYSTMSPNPGPLYTHCIDTDLYHSHWSINITWIMSLIETRKRPYCRPIFHCSIYKLWKNFFLSASSVISFILAQLQLSYSSLLEGCSFN